MKCCVRKLCSLESRYFPLQDARFPRGVRLAHSSPCDLRSLLSREHLCSCVYKKVLSKRASSSHALRGDYSGSRHADPAGVSHLPLQSTCTRMTQKRQTFRKEINEKKSRRHSGVYPFLLSASHCCIEFIFHVTEDFTVYAFNIFICQSFFRIVIGKRKCN